MYAGCDTDCDVHKWAPKMRVINSVGERSISRVREQRGASSPASACDWAGNVARRECASGVRRPGRSGTSAHKCVGHTQHEHPPRHHSEEELSRGAHMFGPQLRTTKWIETLLEARYLWQSTTQTNGYQMFIVGWMVFLLNKLSNNSNYTSSNFLCLTDTYLQHINQLLKFL